MLRATMTRRWCWTLVAAFFLGACADAGLRREVATLRARVDKLEHEKAGGSGDGHGSVDARLAKVERFLAPYIDQPPAPPEPDPQATYAVPLGSAPVVGVADAPVTLVFAFDYACPYCLKERPVIAQLQKQYGANLRVAYKFFIVHPKTATLPAHAACAAERQGKFAEVDAALWKRFESNTEYSREAVLAIADELHLDHARFVADLDGGPCDAIIQGDADLLGKLGMNGTPGTYVNGRFIGGAQPLEVFQKLVDEELARANARIAAGTPAAAYYQKYVVEQGRPER
jgi:protein-disulfide isomerase